MGLHHTGRGGSGNTKKIESKNLVIVDSIKYVEEHLSEAVLYAFYHWTGMLQFACKTIASDSNWDIYGVLLDA